VWHAWSARKQLTCVRAVDRSSRRPRASRAVACSAPCRLFVCVAASHMLCAPTPYASVFACAVLCCWLLYRLLLLRPAVCSSCAAFFFSCVSYHRWCRHSLLVGSKFCAFDNVASSVRLFVCLSAVAPKRRSVLFVRVAFFVVRCCRFVCVFAAHSCASSHSPRAKWLTRSSRQRTTPSSFSSMLCVSRPARSRACAVTAPHCRRTPFAIAPSYGSRCSTAMWRAVPCRSLAARSPALLCPVLFVCCILRSAVSCRAARRVWMLARVLCAVSWSQSSTKAKASVALVVLCPVLLYPCCTLRFVMRHRAKLVVLSFSTSPFAVTHVSSL